MSLRWRFLVAGALLVVVTALSSAWAAWAFRQVSQVVDATVRDSEQTTAATAALASALEREDDALLLALTDEPRGRAMLVAERAAVAKALARLEVLLTAAGETATSRAIERVVDSYHRGGDDLILSPGGARARYHEQVNPLLRRAVAAAASVRDERFRSAQRVASWARDRSARATVILSAVTSLALLVAFVVALYLARTVISPIRDLTAAVEAMRQGDFQRRLPELGGNELGQLGRGFNRMAEDLAAFRRANVHEVVRAKETLEATLAALPDAVVVVESDGSVASANRPAADLDVSPGRGLDQLALPPSTLQAVRVVLDSGRLAGGDVVDLGRAVPFTVQGEARRFLPRVAPIEGLPDGRRGAVLVLSDVTELARLDELRTELVAVASHELRTPLTTLRMTMLMLKERAAELRERDRELVATALGGIDQLAGIVDEFLDLTRIEAGQLRLDKQSIDLVAALQREVDRVRPIGDENGVSIDWTPPAGAVTVAADPARLQVVLANLLANAVKYTPVGGRIVLHVDPATAVVRVQDTGPGVPPEFRERVFEKFFRVEHHRPWSSTARGTGIGLYVAKQIVVAHGGTLTCEGRPGGGASFVLCLKAESRDGGEAQT